MQTPATTEPKHTFTDLARREWTVVIDIASLRRIKEIYPALNATSLPDLARLNLLQAADVLAAILAPNIDAAGLTDAEFFNDLQGDHIAAGVDAMLGAIVDFLPGEQSRAFAAVVKAARELETIVLDETCRLMDRGLSLTEANQVIAEVRAAATATNSEAVAK